MGAGPAISAAWQPPCRHALLAPSSSPPSSLWCHVAHHRWHPCSSRQELLDCLDLLLAVEKVEDVRAHLGPILARKQAGLLASFTQVSPGACAAASASSHSVPAASTASLRAAFSCARRPRTPAKPCAARSLGCAGGGQPGGDLLRHHGQVESERQQLRLYGAA